MNIIGTFYGLVNERLLPPLHNTLTDAGANLFLETLFQAQSVLASSLYLGVCNLDYSFDTTLADVADTEPTNGAYARVALTRNTSDWSISKSGNERTATSVTKTFAAATADWNKPFTQFFLCDCATGSTGNLICVSKQYSDSIYVLSGSIVRAFYSFTLRGKASA